jgi:hypothetical protein
LSRKVPVGGLNRLLRLSHVASLAQRTIVFSENDRRVYCHVTYFASFVAH